MSSIYSSDSPRQHASSLYSHRRSTSPSREHSTRPAHTEYNLNSLFEKLERHESEVDNMQADMAKLRRSFTFGDSEMIDPTDYYLEPEPHEGVWRSGESWDPRIAGYWEENFAHNAPAWNIPTELNTISPYIPQHDSWGSIQDERLSFQRSARRWNAAKPPTLNLATREIYPRPQHSAGLPPRTSSKASPILETQQHMALDSVKSHRRCITVSENRHAQRGLLVFSSPTETPAELQSFPVSKLADSTSSTASIPNESPITPSSLCPPNEDQIRRELEMFALRDGGESLELKYRRRRPPKTPSGHLGDEDPYTVDGMATHHENDDLEYDDPSTSMEPTTLRRQKSLFNLFQRKSPVDKLIEMYMDEDQLEDTGSLKRKASKSRKLAIHGQSSKNQMVVLPPVPRLIRAE